ncbi:phenylalanyl-tRNA synthetase subunit beta [Nesterenkonia sp. AN1]|uniref:phenylalanine--tRNA ligase subunit beta n=1 Tax=Nesterenkonia sp. AN1 TaxID=652017 RepID=UPI0004518F04|nr:phenylalanine--tRNA ligase subunit beta [Nesterenkonia sp. AN1]EXF24085.1 phenylalanyl-tRNA synthetase subunit beta [Nesterenkonia sp. AN1]
MRIPLSWIREYTQFPASGTAEDLMAELVQVGLEEEDVHRPTDELSGPIVVGEVLEKIPEPQSNGKTINWCQVRVVPEGAAQTLTHEGIDPSGIQGVVCGAHNFEVGDKVVVTLPGAVLPGDFRIAARKTYGHVSAGMIASVRELGIGEDHDGILVLSRLGLDPEPGTDAMELLGLYDSAAEINVTPDRGYAFSLRGIAREYSHATGTPFIDPAGQISTTKDDDDAARPGHEVSLTDDTPIYGVQGCSRFVTHKVTGINPTAPTPPWMAARLRLAGMRTISIAVDVSNYVMLELGQPNHCYDAAKLDGGIEVRRARIGEQLTTLDEKVRTLDAEDLVIADQSGPIGIAGVMGGARTEVDATTSAVIVEAAHFDPISVSRSKRRHKLPSEASKRFERGVDPLLPPLAAQRVVDLLVQLAGGTDSREVTDAGAAALPQPIRLDPALPERLTGVAYTQEQISSTLGAIGAEVGQEGEQLLVTPPSWRPDLTIPAALVEEIARLVGYDKIPSRLPVPPAGRGLTTAHQRRRGVYAGMAAAGFTEVLSYPFYSEAANTRFGQAEDTGKPMPMLRLANPIASQHPALRTTVLPGLLEALRRNVSRGFTDVALFEAGSVFHPKVQLGSPSIPELGAYPGEEVLAGLDAGIPDQPLHIAAALSGAESAELPGVPGRRRDWADAVDAAQKVADLLRVRLEVVQGQHQAFHPGRTAELRFNGARIGHAGELHPKVIEELDLPARTSVMELDLSVLIEGSPEQISAEPISTFPPTTQDVSLIVAQELPAAELEATLVEGAGELLESIELFDVYAGEHIEAGHKSLAFGLRFRAEDRTLTAEEASAARAEAVALAQQRHGAVQR